MKIITLKELSNIQRDFVNKHEVANVYTSQFENREYHKDYLCEDGATGTEINRIVTEEVEIEVKGVKVKVKVELWETEWFDTDTGTSVYVYQKA